ncbi:MAG TPA: bifunctional diaminohydroxyphosphoribosylaminopyrimidine deaminase/5-amino-6-(5-phosphoribosylamino)uracil reductase RibD [Gammaproteobacteria bacterium]|nr:bifunctional diaminohydroxyphosphoribosylaminopyrimidine deaminase/5-amino-6-(5-phosphoribosylamino)uracil reductase RibD [Gammaproteobacteria bacterium]
MSKTEDSKHMARALKLAQRGLYSTDPNPRVGCVLVRHGAVVGEGFHARAGDAHAEIKAIEAAGEAARGATAYVTLEPCCHSGRTGPCTQRLIAAGVGTVVAAMRDPNPEVCGQGLAALESAGVRVREGLMKSEAADLNPGFISRMIRGRPHLRLKLAASLDGRTALASGESRWITGAEARRDVQRLRARSSAVLTGVGTVLADDPRLDVRENFCPRAAYDGGQIRQPLRVIVDSRLRTPPAARIISPPGSVLVATRDDGTSAADALRSAGAEVAAFPASGERVDLALLLASLAERGINELHAECGATLAGALLEAGLVDELVLYLAPVLLGSNARPLAVLEEITGMGQRLELHLQELRAVGEDIRLTARPGTRR